MKLLWLSVRNWRQFEGEAQKIEFASDPDRNVTVIHGANGSGKTALLNALTWAFHGHLTDALAMHDNLVNRRAIAEAKPGERVDAVVNVRFEHGDRVYDLKRTASVIRGETPTEWTELEPTLSLLSAGPDGHWNPVKPEEIPDVIGRIMPEQLLPYFFFDGERIGNLHRPDKRSEITSAVTMLIGELVLNRAIEDLETIEKRLTREMRRALVDDEVTSALIQELEELKIELEEAQRTKETLEKNLEGLIRRRQAIDQELQALKSVEDLVRRRSEYESEEATLRTNIEANLASIASEISKHGFRVFLRSASEGFLSRVTELRNRGELPTALKVPFLQRLLEQKRCICGRELVPGEPPYAEIQRWMEHVGLSEIEETAIRMEAEIQSMERQIPEMFERLDQETARFDANRKRLAQVETLLGSIREQLKNGPVEQSRDLERAREQTEQDIDRIRAQQVENRHKIQTLSEELRRKQQAINEMEVKTKEQEVCKTRYSICREVINILKEVKRRQQVHFRADLSDRINRIFSQISIKPYTAVLNPDYTLSVYETPGGLPVPLSTGEMQVLSLSFIGGVIEQARIFAARRDRLPRPDSSTFPLVMDSPFGSLDPHHRGQVAAFMPKLANQVVILSTRSQWEADVENALKSRIGKEYVLSYYSPKPGVQEDYIVRNGKTYWLVRRSGDDFERTEILEVCR